ncbi:MAG TPA: YfiR family protein [Burkholderiaceae bacterium]|nr:YfiR family protein [Burkholderiaceae bacterium]
MRSLVWTLVLLAQPVVPAHAQQAEGTVKAAFVFNFLRFTQWPPSRMSARDTPMYVCVWNGDARLSESLKSLAGRSVDEHVVRVLELERADELGRCNALFVPDSVMRSMPASVLHKAELLDVLTMGDADGFAAGGGMIGLVSDGARIRFEINERSVKRSGLKLAAQLYKLGRLLNDGGAK